MTASAPTALKDELAQDTVTPMMAQYLEIKAAHQDYLLFYRMGDFYELFFDDAVAASQALDITLTKRGQHLGDDIPMCGVPVHSADSYLARLIRKNFKVAVAEQMEDPAEAKKRGSKSVVKRGVVRLVTPGTLTEDTLLDARAANFLVAIARAEAQLALAWADMSTGDFHLKLSDAARLDADLARLSPQEVLIPQALLNEDGLTKALFDWRTKLTPRSAGQSDSQKGEDRLKTLFKVQSLDGFGDFTRAHLAAASLLLDYVEETQKGQLPHISPPKVEDTGAVMVIDAATRRSLEINNAMMGRREGSLIDTIDRTVTGPGARLLSDWVNAPLTDAEAINARLDMVECFLDQGPLRRDIRAALKETPDMERALTRLSLERGGPRDLRAICQGLNQAIAMRLRLEAAGGEGVIFSPDLSQIQTDLGHHGQLVDALERAVIIDAPLLTRDGGFIARGYDPALDELCQLRDEGKRMIAALEGDYRGQTGINTLKIKHNNVLGFHIDVPAKSADKLMGPPHVDVFIHRQTLANSVRFSTQKLAELAGKISQAGEAALARELELFEALSNQVKDHAHAIMQAAHALSRLDVIAALADLAAVKNYARPKVDDTLNFTITQGRHPVVEAARRQAHESFIANDCDLSPGKRLWLITGPNMAGKSTFLRQNALIAILAQAGSFVPAAKAHIGVIDRLFSRVGAADDLAHGRSTFMVEMVETAAILNQATKRSFVILDEIGRGTATYDGLSIAWACVEHLHDMNKARALFATHYHELTALKERLDNLSLHALKVKEWQGDLVFLHEVGEGAADRSYGVQVARLAGLPSPVIARAREVLDRLEAGGGHNPAAKLGDDLPLFSAPPIRASGPKIDPLREMVDDIHPDELTPRQALDLIYALKARSREGSDI